MEIEVKQELKPNEEILEVIKNYTYSIKNGKEYLDYLNVILNNNNIGIKYKELITKEELINLEEDYLIVSTQKIKNNEYSKNFLQQITEQMDRHFYTDELINCPYFEDGNITYNLILIPKEKGVLSFATS